MAAEVTVVMPVHDVEAYVHSAVISILRQTHSDFELWVLENGSRDATLEAVRAIVDPRVRIFDLGPVGFQGALDFGLRHAKSKWIVRMDGDDLCFPNRLETQIAWLKSNTGIKLVGTAYARLTEFDHVLEPRLPGRTGNRALTDASFSLMDNGNRRYCADASIIFDREAALEVGGYDEEFIMGDVPLWLRMLRRFAGWELSEVLYIARIRQMSFGGQNSDGARVRLKYGIDAGRKVGVEGLAFPDSPEVRQFNYWRRILKLELYCDHFGTIWSICHRLRKCGKLGTLGRVALILVCLGPLGAWLWSKRNSDQFRRRRDWEAQFASIIPVQDL